LEAEGHAWPLRYRWYGRKRSRGLRWKNATVTWLGHLLNDIGVVAREAQDLLLVIVLRLVVALRLVALLRLIFVLMMLRILDFGLMKKNMIGS
jgi:hypothetical protein